MALPTIQETIDYASLAIGYTANNNSLGALFGQRLAAPASPVTQQIVTDALQWALDGGAVPDTTLRNMANYLTWLTVPFFTKAQGVISGGSGGGSVIPGGGAGYVYTEISSTISADSTTYQNNTMILGKDLSFVILNNQMLTTNNNDFSFNTLTGTLTFISVSLFTGDKLTIPFNRKL